MKKVKVMPLKYDGVVFTSRTIIEKKIGKSKDLFG